MNQGNLFEDGALPVWGDRVVSILAVAPARALRRFIAPAVIAVVIALTMVLLPFMQWGLVVWNRVVREDLVTARWAEGLPQHAELRIRQLHRRLRG